MLFSEFKALRMAELMQEQWGRERIPDLLEIFYKGCRPRSVLEIGCWQGVSTEFWALHCARVVAVDPWPDIQVRRRFQARVSHYPHVEMVEGYSPDILENMKGMFDLVYIDGDHDYEPVKADIRATYELVPSWGWIGGHDYGSCPGVQQAVDELLGPPTHRCSDGSWLIHKAQTRIPHAPRATVHEVRD